MKNNGAGKGDSYRKVDQKKWDENYARIFGKSAKSGKKNENNCKDR